MQEAWLGVAIAALSVAALGIVLLARESRRWCETLSRRGQVTEYRPAATRTGS